MSLSVIIPSRDPRYLQRTIDDVVAKARSADPIEVIVVLDGYDTIVRADPHVNVLQFAQHRGMRAAINAGMQVASYNTRMKLDEHCLLAEGFDTQLMLDRRDNMVMIPRRYRLDPDKWEVIVDGRPPIDYMRLQFDPGYIHGVEWRRPERAGPEFYIDDTPAFQGSCWLMMAYTWHQIGPMDDATYGPFANEAQEIASKVLALEGGRVVVDKRTFYAHWRKGQAGTGYGFTHEQADTFEREKQAGRKAFYDDYKARHDDSG
jgi:glycosyltransferase involved in cell wall biosynthesis